MSGVDHHHAASIRRVLFVAQRLGSGGMTRYLSENAVALAEMGREVHVLTPRGDEARAVLAPAVHAGAVMRWVDRLGAGDLRRAIADVQPDAVRLCSGKAPPDTRLIWGQIGAGCAIVESVHLPSRRERPSVMQSLAFRLRPKRGYRLLAFSRGMSASLAASVPALRGCLRTLTYGLGLPAVLPARVAASDSRLRLVALSRLDERQKNLSCVLRALALRADLRNRTRLAIVGDGPDRGLLERLAAELGLGEVVTFEGWTADPLARLAAADVLVNSTRVESFGRTNVEAAALGVPVIASRVMGCEESVAHERSGLLVEPDDAAALAAAVARLLDDAALRARLSAAGLAWAATFDIRSHAAAILDVAAEALGEVRAERDSSR